MSINGNGILAHEWSALLEQLTLRADLHTLTTPSLIGDLSSGRLLRRGPAWCPMCLSEWREKGEPIYQPLLWMLQIVTICPLHKKRLYDRCPRCRRRQPVIVTNKVRPGECTHCATWLGTKSEERQDPVSDETMAAWQEWLMTALEELHTLGLSSSVFRWESFFTSLATCMQERGAYTRVARMTGMRRETLYKWRSASYTPTLEAILKLCYVFDVTPFQMMTNHTARLRQLLESETATRAPQFPRHYCRFDRGRCQTYLQAVLDGDEKPQAFRQIAKHLGFAQSQMYYHFPKECAVIAPLMQAYRQQRKEERLNRVREHVRQAVMSLHSRGVYPSQRRLRPLLAAGTMRLSEAKEAWHATLRELGFEP